MLKDHRALHGPMILVKLTAEFVIVGKFGGHELHHLTSRLANVIKQRGRKGGKQTKHLVLAIFF